MGEFTRPMPVPTPTAQPFWDALAAHKIRIQYSPSAQRYVFYPRVLAPGTLADDLEWREISGAASLHTYTVAYRPVAPHFADEVPHIVAVAQWDEGPRFATEIVNAEPSELQVGMRITPIFVDVPEEGLTLLRYEPA